LKRRHQQQQQPKEESKKDRTDSRARHKAVGGGWVQSGRGREEVPGRRQRLPKGRRAPAKCAERGGTGEVKRRVGEPNSQIGKSYANSALPRANQCSPSALPRDWLAPEDGGAERPGIPALPIQVHARIHPREPPAHSARSPCSRSGSRPAVYARV
jgi:hypothetical protein